MKVEKAKNGYKFLKATSFEIIKLGGFSICDFCNCLASNGYLVPVLNQYLCPKCFEAWEKEGDFYPEDVPHQEKVLERYRQIFEVEDEN